MNEQFFRKTSVVIIGALICCALWGSAFPCIKIGYNLTNIESGDTASQILYAGMRFTLAGILSIIIGSVAGKKMLYPRREAIPKILLLCVFQTVLQYVFFYIGLAHTDGAKASIIEGMNVFVALIIAAIFFKNDRLNIRKIVGCILGTLGILIVNINDFSVKGLANILGGFAWNGELFILLSTVAYGISSVVMKKFSPGENTTMLSGYQFVAGGLVMAAIGIGMGGRVSISSTPQVAMLIYLALVSAVAYSLWSILLKYNAISKVSVYGFTNPIFGLILSTVLLDERSYITFSAFLALLLVCLGIYIVNRPKN